MRRSARSTQRSNGISPGRSSTRPASSGSPTPSARRDACMAANADGAGHARPGLRGRAGIPARHLLVRPGVRRLARPPLWRRATRSARPPSTGTARPRRERLVLGRRRQAADRPHQRLFRPLGPLQFRLARARARCARGEPVSASRASIVSPTFVPDLCHAALDLLIDGETGHLAPRQRGRAQLVRFRPAIAEGAGLIRPDLCAGRPSRRRVTRPGQRARHAAAAARPGARRLLAEVEDRGRRRSRRSDCLAPPAPEDWLDLLRRLGPDRAAAAADSTCRRRRACGTRRAPGRPPGPYCNSDRWRAGRRTSRPGSRSASASYCLNNA